MINCLEDVDVDVLEDVDGNGLEDVDNVDNLVGVRCNFYVCRRRRRERKTRQSVNFVRSFVVRRVVLEYSSSSVKLNPLATTSTPLKQHRNTHLNQLSLLPSLSLHFPSSQLSQSPLNEQRDKRASRAKNARSQ